MLRRFFSLLDQTLKAGCLALIKTYQWLLSPVLGKRCRFYPTCSQYAHEALQIHAVPYALWLIVKRLLKCHPFGSSGFDPVPAKERPHGHTKD